MQNSIFKVAVSGFLPYETNNFATVSEVKNYAFGELVAAVGWMKAQTLDINVELIKQKGKENDRRTIQVGI